VKRWFDRLRIHQKLVVSALLITGVALGCATAGLGALEVWRYQDIARDDVEATAQMLGENVAAAVAFQDAAAATEILRSLRGRSRVTRACIFTTDGRLFASFEPHRACPAQPVNAGRFEGIAGVSTINRGGRSLGSVHVESSPGDIWERVLFTAVTGIAMWGIAAVVAYGLAQRVYRSTSEPLMKLAAFARDFGHESAPDPALIGAAPDEVGDLVVSFGDMVGRIRTIQAELARHAVQLQLVTDAMPALISYVGRDGRYRFVNRGYEEWFGHAQHTITGRTMHDVLGAAAFSRIQPYVASALEGHSVRYDAEVPYTAGTRYIHAEYVPDIRPDGYVDGFFALVTDITARRQAEEALREADRRKDEFLAILAHELRNPLAPIRTGLELLRRAGNQPETLDRVGSILERQVVHLTRLVDDLLDVSRITSGKIALRRRLCTLKDLVDRAVELRHC
jgi:PAS domain S-box-containing protein